MLHHSESIAVAFVVAVSAGLLLSSSINREEAKKLDDERSRPIDGLRGFLALAVVTHHYAIWLQADRLGGDWAAPSSNFINQLGAGSVGLFFMITGIVFYPKIVKGFGNLAWGSIYVGRLARILPLTIVSIGIVSVLTMSRTAHVPTAKDLQLALMWVVSSGEPGFLGDSRAGQTNAYVLWSLHYEWMFYILIMPIAAIVLEWAPARWERLTVLGVAGGAALMCRSTDAGAGLLYFLPLFTIGMAIAEMREHPLLKKLLCGNAASCFALVALLAGMVLFKNPYGWGLPLFGFFLLCVACGNSMFGLLTRRGAITLGDISFSIYLLHGCVLSLTFVEGARLARPDYGIDMVAMLTLVVMVVICISHLSYRFIEQPGMALGRLCIRHGSSWGSVTWTALRTAKVGLSRHR